MSHKRETLTIIAVKFPNFAKDTKSAKKLNVLFPTTNITENIQKYYEVYSIFLPIFTVATDAEAKFKHYRNVSGRDSTPHSQFDLETH
jgi:glucose-6-phosphate isomerase